MTKFLSGMLAACLAFVTVEGKGAVVINEVYSGGGSSNVLATFTRDFVELYNTGTTAVDISGWQLLYASATGQFTNTIAVFESGSLIGASDYFTIVTGAPGTGGATITSAQANLITALNTASLSAGSGSVSLFDATSAQIDVLGFGSPSASGTIIPGGVSYPKFETTAATAGNVSTSMNRSLFADTGNNSLDFTGATPSPTLGVTSVPEPSSLALLGLIGVAGFVARRRRASALA